MFRSFFVNSYRAADPIFWNTISRKSSSFNPMHRSFCTKYVREINLILWKPTSRKKLSIIPGYLRSTSLRKCTLLCKNRLLGVFRVSTHNVQVDSCHSYNSYSVGTLVWKKFQKHIFENVLEHWIK